MADQKQNIHGNYVPEDMEYKTAAERFGKIIPLLQKGNKKSTRIAKSLVLAITEAK